jgi:SAM-dependent methyltransferase
MKDSTDQDGRGPHQQREQSFDLVAAAYDEVRPSYPGALYDHILEFAALAPTARVLEVGVGTAKATLPLAERGFEILGLEPGAELSRIARAKLQQFPRVSLNTTTFEDWTLEPCAFDLAFCAQAYHWLDPARRLQRFAEALHQEGVVAIFGNVSSLPAGSLRDNLAASYQQLAPSLSLQRGAASWYATEESPVMSELCAHPLFEDVSFTAFDWQRTLSAEQYCQLLSTYSDHFGLPAATLAALLARVADVVRAHGGVLSLAYRTGVFLARRSR